MHINIREILYKKTGRRLPKFVTTPLERLIHQDEMNTIFAACEGATPAEFLKYVFNYLDITCSVEYTAPLADDGRYIFASNHPFGGLDGMLLVNALLTRWGDAGAVVNDLLMNVKYLAPLWIPINKYGKQDADKSRCYDEAFASPTKQILTFPAGFCSRFINGEVADTEWKSHFIKDAIKYNREVIPTFVDGTLSKRFYRIYRLRKFLHINLNLELILLVDEMFKQRGRHIRIIVGEPVDITTIEGSRAEQCAEIRKRVYNLKKR